MNRLLVLWGVLLAFGGCMPSLQIQLTDPTSLKQPSTEEAHGHPAVVLKHDQRILLFAPGHRSPYFEVQEHKVIAILAEDGFARAAVKIPTWDETEITNFAARTISPDGVVQEVRQQDLKEDESVYAPGHNTKLRVFHFPRVAVGSILEMAYTVHTPSFRGLFYGDIVDDLPVREYNLEIQGNNEIRYAVTAYQVDGQFKVDKGKTDWRLSLGLRDLSPGGTGASEDWRPSKRLRRPWWVFRVPKVVFKRMMSTRAFRLYVDWPNAMEYMIENLYEKTEAYGDYRVGVSSEGCADRRCVIERSMNVVRSKVEFSGFGTYGGADPLDEVVKRGYGGSFEKTIMLWSVLKRSGVEAEYAPLVRNFTGHLDKAFPWGGWFNHLILRVPVQEGIEAPIWIDPSCEGCSLGQLPIWSRGAEALVLRSTPEPQATFQTATGDPPPINLYRLTHDLQLAPDGDALVNTLVEYLGTDAVWRRKRIRDWSTSDWQKDTESFASKRSPRPTLLRHSPGTCDRANSWCKRTIAFEAPGYATPTTDKLIVPLAVFHSSWDGRFVRPKRNHDVVATDTHPTEEIARIHVPLGYKVDDLPPDTAGEAHGFRYEASARVEGDVVVVRRFITNETGRFPRAGYPEIRQVSRDHHKIRDWAVILKRKPGAGKRP